MNPLSVYGLVAFLLGFAGLFSLREAFDWYALSASFASLAAGAFFCAHLVPQRKMVPVRVRTRD